jgi:hypothetical protein
MNVQKRVVNNCTGFLNNGQILTRLQALATVCHYGLLSFIVILLIYFGVVNKCLHVAIIHCV